jgi:hypothetical protein
MRFTQRPRKVLRRKLNGDSPRKLFKVSDAPALGIEEAYVEWRTSGPTPSPVSLATKYNSY